MENFVERLHIEKDKLIKNSSAIHLLDGYDAILNNREIIKTKNLFNIFDNKLQKNVWFKFRQSDISAHIGLALFCQTARKCNANIRVVSNKKFLVEQNNIFNYNYLEEPQLDDLSNETYIIPGTQIDMEIPINEINQNNVNNGIVQLNIGERICENYKSYSKYLSYNVQEIDYKTIEESIHRTKTLSVTNPEEKFYLQNMWTSCFVNLFCSMVDQSHSIIHTIDCEKTVELPSFLSSNDYGEIFIKGLFAATGSITSNNEVFFAIINAPKKFIDLFKKISSSSLALMKFPTNLQLFLSENNKALLDEKQQIVFLGSTVGNAVRNSYGLSLEQGFSSFQINEYHTATNLLNVFDSQISSSTLSKNPDEFLVMPFSSFFINDNNISYYFNHIKALSEQPITNNKNDNSKGYKYTNTHMRLGNKVHAEEFYEMSFLFYRTAIANRVAFHILRDLLNKNLINKCIEDNRNIVFFGYASYSQAIIMSLTEMLNGYITDNSTKPFKGNVYYASYQYNLQTTSNGINIKIHRNTQNIINNSVIIQIVPISSTLTTFDKMWEKYLSTFSNETPRLVANYTVYLVRHQVRENNNLTINTDAISEIESKYWENINNKKGIITLKSNVFKNLKGCNSINFIMSGGSHWHIPVKCSFCYPESVFYEMPLVETDPTSTIPTQQIHIPKKTCTENKDNLMRIKDLYGCVYYGHFCRGKNHFQYFINTQTYFAKSQQKIKEWLTNEKNKDHQKGTDNQPTLNIIFSPEHNTNVGFSQYVNSYYFNGTAEIVSVNEDKQFRANFINENNEIKQTIQKLFNDFSCQDKRVKFYFVDDNIVTGETYRKANSLLQSLIPQECLNLYGTNVFEKCFILIDRLSYSTKQSYVVCPEENFISYCKVNISNMRSHGDSCTGCKLEKEANRLFKRASLGYVADYWAKKSEDYKVVAFDDQKLENYDLEESYIRLSLSHSIQNKISSISSSENGEFFDWVFNVLKYLIDEDNTDVEYETKVFIDESKQKSGKSTYDLITTFLKLLSRPFYTYDYGIKTQTLRILIILSEVLISNPDKDEIDILLKTEKKEYQHIKEFYLTNNRGKKAIKIAYQIKQLIHKMGLSKTIEFLQECLFESLTDIKSTYLLRKSTLKKVAAFFGEFDSVSECEKLNKQEYGVCRKKPSSCQCNGDMVLCFWHQYANNIHKIIDTSSDETRALWMEYLLLTGNEYNDKDYKESPINIHALYNDIETNMKSDTESIFKAFCEQIFLQNNRIIFDGLEKEAERRQANSKKTDDENNPYFMDNYYTCRTLLSKYETLPIEDGEIDLYRILDSDNGNNTQEINKTNDSIVDIRYYKLLDGIKNMISNKYMVLTYDNINIALLTGREELDEKEYTLDIIRTDFENQYGMIVDNAQIKKWSKMKSIIKERVKESFEPTGTNCNKLSYNDYDYCIVQCEEDTDDKHYNSTQKDIYYDKNSPFHKPYIILKFNNSELDQNHKLGRQMKSIADVYIYISLIIPNNDYNERIILPWLITRDLLSYRHRLLKYFEEDFNNDIIQRNARSHQEKTILEHEKAASHSSSEDDSMCLKIFINNAEGRSEITEERLLLLRDYTNVTISKLFNRSFHENEKNSKISIKTPMQDVPELYLEHNKDGNALKRCLVLFKDLEIENGTDNRFEWLKQILDLTFIGISDNTKFLKTKSPANESTISPMRYYNLEYSKCLIVDILLSAAKSKSLNINYLNDINYLMNINKYNNMSEDSYRIIRKNSNKVYFTRTITPKDYSFDYLTIINSINQRGDLNEQSIKIKNQEIMYHLTDAIDYYDGHMSLLTIKRYFEHLDELNLKNKTYFKFSKLEDIKQRYSFLLEDADYWFESHLPILEKEQNNEQ